MAAALRRYQAARDRYDALHGDQAAWQAERALERVGLAGAGAGAVALLSGGERNLLSLARALLGDPGLLVLDEPTNHMDIPSCEAIEDALLEFTGTVLLVSHDRYLLDSVATGSTGPSASAGARSPLPPTGADAKFLNHRWRPGLSDWRARRWSWSVRSRGRCSPETGPWSGAMPLACVAWSGKSSGSMNSGPAIE